MNKSIILFCAIVLFGLNASSYAAVSADSNSSRVYIGAGGGLTYMPSYPKQLVHGLSYGLFAGYNLTPHWAAELGYNEATINLSQKNMTAKFTVKTSSISIIHVSHITSKLLFGELLGAGYIVENLSPTGNKPKNETEYNNENSMQNGPYPQQYPSSHHSHSSSKFSSRPSPAWRPLAGLLVRYDWTKHFSSDVRVTCILSDKVVLPVLNTELTLAVNF